MPRLKAEVVEQRKNFIIKFFNDNMAMMGQAAFDAAAKEIKRVTGMAMAPNTIIDLFEQAHAGKVKAKEIKVELLAPKPKLGPGGPMVPGLISEDQSNLIAALRKALAERDEVIKGLREEVQGLRLATKAMREGGKLVRGMTVFDVTGEVPQGALDTMVETMKG